MLVHQRVHEDRGTRALGVVKTRSRRWIPYLVFGLSLGIYLYPFMRCLLLSGDEGAFLYGAVRVTEGQVPFRDFFEVSGPGSFYWLALFFKLFGTTILATRISLVLTSVSTALLMYFLTRRLKTEYGVMPPVFFLATSFSSLWPAISHHNESNGFALLSFAAFISWIDTRRPTALWVAGALAGVTTCFMQPKGILLLVSFFVLVCIFRRQRELLVSLSWVTAGYMAMLGMVLGLYWRAGGLSALVYANFVWPLTQYNTVNIVPYAQGIGNLYWLPWATALSAAVPPSIAIAVASFLIIPLLFVAALPAIAGLFALRYRARAFDHLTVPYWVAGIALWLSEIHRKDITHLAYGSPLLVILIWYLLGRERQRFSVCARQLIFVSTFALAAFNGFVMLSARTKIETRRGAFYAFAHDPVLKFLDAHVEPGDAIFAYPCRPMYYFLTGAQDPTPFSLLMYHINTDSQFHDAVACLREKKVRYVIWDRTFDDKVKQVFPTYALPPTERQIMEPYLTAHYQIVKRLDGFDILQRKPEPELVRKR